MWRAGAAITWCAPLPGDWAEAVDEAAGADGRVLRGEGDDGRCVIYTTAPGSEDEGKLDLARVAGARRGR
jgi:hypothetical protein